jgi:hypothetical protein
MKDYNYKCWKVTVRSTDCVYDESSKVYKFPIFIRDADSKNGFDVCVQDLIVSFWNLDEADLFYLAPPPKNLDVIELLSNTLIDSSSYDTKLGGVNKTLAVIAISNSSIGNNAVTNNPVDIVPSSLDSGIFQQWGGENWVTVQNINGTQEIYFKTGQYENIPTDEDSNTIRFYLTLKIKEHQPEKY